MKTKSLTDERGPVSAPMNPRVARALLARAKQGRPHESITVEWSHFSVPPKAWTIEVEGGGKRVFTRTVDGALTSFTLPGLPGLQDPAPPATTRSYYVVWVTPTGWVERTGWELKPAPEPLRIPVGLLRVPAA